jgi:sulfur carrier protein
MQLQVNGESFEFEGNTVTDLVTQMKLSERRIAIELNQEILPKSEYDDTQLKEDDRLEIIHAIGGG